MQFLAIFFLGVWISLSQTGVEVSDIEPNVALFLVWGIHTFFMVISHHSLKDNERKDSSFAQ